MTGTDFWNKDFETGSPPNGDKEVVLPSKKGAE